MATDRRAVRLRAAVESLPAYVPGARPTGRRMFKLSSNEVPYPPLPGVVAAVTTAAGEVNRYPDMYAADLLRAVAARYGVEEDQVVVGNGSVALLEHLLAAACDAGDEVVYAWRSFEAYPIAVQVAGARSVQVPVDGAGRHDLAAMAAAVTDRTRMVLVCSPNNPTGPAVHADELRAFLDAVPPTVLVVLDEAYTEFVRDPRAADGVGLLRERPNVVVLRTFSKAYGLAGLRAGYALGAPRVVAAVRAASTPFGVNTLAQAAAIAALDAADEMRERVAAVVAERERITSALNAQGWRIPEAQGNFVWLPLGPRAVDFATAAAAAGVLVRPFAGDGVRVSIGEREAGDLFLEVAAGWA